MRLNLKYASLKNAYDLLSMLWLRVAHLVCIPSILLFMPILLGAIHVGDAFFESTLKNMLAPYYYESDYLSLMHASLPSLALYARTCEY